MADLPWGGGTILRLEVIDLMPVGDDGDGHLPGVECPCSPSCLTDGSGGFYCYHTSWTERIIG